MNQKNPGFEHSSSFLHGNQKTEKALSLNFEVLQESDDF